MAYRDTDQATNTRRLIDIPATDMRFELDPEVDYQDRFRGAMVGTATSDALGPALEGMPPYRIRRQHGYVTELIPWGGHVSGPKGTLTDDTEMTLCLAQSIIEKGGVDPHDVAERFMYWGLTGRGMGDATRAACKRLAKGSPWVEAGSASAGNASLHRSRPTGNAGSLVTIWKQHTHSRDLLTASASCPTAKPSPRSSTRTGRSPDTGNGYEVRPPIDRELHLD